MAVGVEKMVAEGDGITDYMNAYMVLLLVYQECIMFRKRLFMIFHAVEKKLSKYLPENLTVFILIGQVLGFILLSMNPSVMSQFTLRGDMLLRGELWRVVAFLVNPISLNPIFFAFGAYLYYLMGTGLEKRWGTFKYMVYLLAQYVFILCISLIFPRDPISNTFLFTSIFVAFAHLHPDFLLYLFFFIPVKMKWLAWITWAGLLLNLLMGTGSLQLTILATIIVYVIFFRHDILQKVPTPRNVVHNQPANSGLPKLLSRQCTICHSTNLEVPLFTCRLCRSANYYCSQHIKKHDHT